MHRNAGRVNLGKAWIGKIGASFIGPVGSRNIGCHGVGGKEKYVSVAARTQDDGMGVVAFDRAGNQVPNNDSPGLTVDNDKIQHFAAGEHFDFAGTDLA